MTDQQVIDSRNDDKASGVIVGRWQNTPNPQNCLTTVANGGVIFRLVVMVNFDKKQ